MAKVRFYQRAVLAYTLVMANGRSYQRAMLANTLVMANGRLPVNAAVGNPQVMANVRAGACVVLVAWTLVTLAASTLATSRKRPALYSGPVVPSPRSMPVAAAEAA